PVLGLPGDDLAPLAPHHDLRLGLVGFLHASAPVRIRPPAEDLPKAAPRPQARRPRLDLLLVAGADGGGSAARPPPGSPTVAVACLRGLYGGPGDPATGRLLPWGVGREGR